MMIEYHVLSPKWIKEVGMLGYIDIHSHILPGIDDGSADEKQTRSMLKDAYAQGIRTICATPHFRPSMFRVSLSKRQSAFELTQSIAAEMFPDMKIFLGNELYYAEDGFDYIKDGVCKTMAETRYVLVEFGTSIDYTLLKKRINRFVMEGYIPIIAHIERYDNVRTDIERVEELIEAGAYIQVNAEGICESSFPVRKFVKKLLKYELVHFMASDSHNDTNRSYNFDKAFSYIIKKYGESYLDKLMYYNPDKMLNNEYI